ncbi:hypothetical protein [Dysgonomonas termitidis]|uniref:Bacteriocin n=1 Tax=Dysgonomonas termitidis TaxID=1516126 RepID=A0ABV9KYX0_9BACT
MKKKFENFRKYELSKNMLSRVKGGGQWVKLENGEYVWVDN